MKKEKTKRVYTGINIQYPISQLILSGEKTIETRTYPIPPKYIGEDLLVIETPGKKGKFKARVVAIIRFDDCFKYKSSLDFYKDSHRHRVTNDSPWAWKDKKQKWGWSISSLKKVVHQTTLPKKRGIVFTLNLKL